ncbi:hypothetical protein PBI_OVECHKIN_83 [Mycobacterium phage Ovechkin]|uniref:Uncharacterized protein n=1 Tax=Mycobacterium phage Ovechkin TaxID=1673889 RepID=A0A0H4TF76_9CAUD|nr:hypothetical protein PBI_OVECHKIN_83 [Mycobacterium phage Ovechkin]AKQ06985.1 hypothetical protein PBI_OVECHKIN_83 [Mycobacterium phage Ovechkin]
MSDAAERAKAALDDTRCTDTMMDFFQVGLVRELVAEVERLRARETLIRELCGGDWIMVKNPLNDDKRERAVWAAEILAALAGEEA